MVSLSLSGPIGRFLRLSFMGLARSVGFIHFYPRRDRGLLESGGPSADAISIDDEPDAEYEKILRFRANQSRWRVKDRVGETMTDKVVLAYSGGLDTSVCVRWLNKERNLQVVAFSANLGQEESLEPLGERAVEAGASSCHIIDLRERFVHDYIWRAVKANAAYEQGYLLATALGRYLIATEQVRIAHEEGAKYIAHGCTGKGNDQVRFEAAVAALDPKLKVIAPVREWNMKSREEEIEYARKYNIPLPPPKVSKYSYDRNLWGTAIECGELEDPWAEPPADAYVMTTAPEDAPDQSQYVDLEFEGGVPVALEGEKLGGVELIEKLNKIAGRHGVGRTDFVENRLVGIKSREVYEAPAGTVIYTAHRALEALTLSRDVLHFKDLLSQRYAELIYTGLWFSDLRRALDAFFDQVNTDVVGSVRLKLYKGSCVAVGRKSPRSLYSKAMATYTPEDQFDHKASAGFIHIWSLPLKGESRRRKDPTQ